MRLWRHVNWIGLLAVVLFFVASPGPPAQAELRGHGGFVKGVAVSPDGRTAATASFDYSVMLWDIASQKPLRRLEGHEAAVNVVAFLPSGDRIVSGGDDATLRLWDASSGALLHTFAGHKGKIAGLAVSADGRWAASAAWDRSVRLWDLENLSPGPAIESKGGNPNAVAFSPDGKMLLTGGYDSKLRLWRLPDMTLTLELPGHDFAVTSLAFLDDRHAISVSVDKTLRTWDLERAEEIVSLPGHEDPIFGVAVSGDRRFAASGGADSTVILWNLETETFVRAFYGHSAPVWALAFTPDGKTLLSAGSDEVVRVWDLASGEEIGIDGTRRVAAGPAIPEVEGAERGAALFRRCAVCHSVTADGGKRAGPTLYGVFGRRAGTVAGYQYSDALKNSDLVWNEKTIDALFAEGPHEYTPGSKMPLQRMPRADDREELIAYLKRITAPTQ